MAKVIVIDPGHGGTTIVGGSSPNNATGPVLKLKEKDLALALALKVSDNVLLSPYTRFLTRKKDENLGIVDRAKVAKEKSADVFVSIHFNGFKDPTVQGSEAWYGAGAPQDCATLGRSILHHLIAANGLKNRGVKVTTDQEYGVVNPANHLTTTAYTLVEVSFLTEPAEEARLAQDTYLNVLAAAIAHGIDDFLKGSSGTALHFAVQSHSIGSVRELIRAAANVNAVDGKGMTPLMYAAKAGSQRLVKMLLKAGADPNKSALGHSQKRRRGGQLGWKGRRAPRGRK